MRRNYVSYITSAQGHDSCIDWRLWLHPHDPLLNRLTDSHREQEQERRQIENTSERETDRKTETHRENETE